MNSDIQRWINGLRPNDKVRLLKFDQMFIATILDVDQVNNGIWFQWIDSDRVKKVSWVPIDATSISSAGFKLLPIDMISLLAADCRKLMPDDYTFSEFNHEFATLMIEECCRVIGNVLYENKLKSHFGLKHE